MNRSIMLPALFVSLACTGAPDGKPDGSSLPPAGVDTDGDGLDDAFELAANEPSLLSHESADTDGDSIPDGDEDPDGDRLLNRVEHALSDFPTLGGAVPFSPVRTDVLVELDCMVERCLPAAAASLAAGAFDAAEVSVVAGHPGVGLHIFLDETTLPVSDFDGSFEQRHAFFHDHGPASTVLTDSDFPSSRMLHVMVATRRTDIEGRGGEAVTHAGGDVESTGVIIYHDTLSGLHPACGVASDPSRPDISLDEALAGTFIHEVGHLLQLGHDTAAGGDVNPYNIMSLPQSCGDAQKRFHGYGNQDASLGATQSVRASRFSEAAAALMDFDAMISVDTAQLVGDVGREM